MADKPVDTLQIQISAQAEKAGKAIDTLTTKLAALKNTVASLNPGLKETISELTKFDYAKSALAQMKALTAATNNMNNAAMSLARTVSSVSLRAREMASGVSSTSDTSEVASASMGHFNSALLKVGTGIKKVLLAPLNLLKKAFKSIESALVSPIKKLGAFFSSLKRIAGYRLIRSALKAITQGFNEGIQNLYQWSLAVNTSFAPSMDKLATSMLYLKNGFASMFSPLIEYFIPYIDMLVDKLVNAFNWVQELFAKLTGRETWNKAIKVQTQYAEAAENTAGAVRDVREQLQLMDFDELNLITENQNNGSGSGSGKTTPNYGEMFQVVQTNEPMKGTLIENLREWWNGLDLKNIGSNIGQKIYEWLHSIDFKQIWEDIKSIAKGVWEFAGGIFDTLIRPLAKELWAWFKKVNWGKVGNAIGGAFRKVIEKFSNWWNAGGREKLIEVIREGVSAIWEIVVGIFDGLFPNMRTDNAKTSEDTRNTDEVIADALAIARNTPSTNLEDKIVQQGRAKSALQKQLRELFTDSQGVFNEAEMNRYIEIWTKGAGIYDENTDDRQILTAVKKILDAMEELETDTKQTRWWGNTAYSTTFHGGGGGVAAPAEADPYNGRNTPQLLALTKRYILNAVDAGEITQQYKWTAEMALDAYLTKVEWSKGGEISAEEIRRAFINKGIPKDMANEAAEGVYLYLEEYRSKYGQAKETGRTFGANIASGITEGLSSSLVSGLAAWSANTAGKYTAKSLLNGTSASRAVAKITPAVYAEGGFPKAGTLMVAGETMNQTEFLGNINGKTGVVSGDEISGIGDAVYSTGNTTHRLLSELISVVQGKNLTISPSANLGRVVAKSERLYAAQMG